MLSLSDLVTLSASLRVVLSRLSSFTTDKGGPGEHAPYANYQHEYKYVARRRNVSLRRSVGDLRTRMRQREELCATVRCVVIYTPRVTRREKPERKIRNKHI